MGHTILLADDSITIQKVIELTFSDEDFKLHTVGNGQKAIDEIHSVKPDIVLCDIIMPEKNGYEVCEYIKSNPDLKHTPVLLLTGAFEPFDQERARNAGCDGFLAKPFEPQTLISKVKELLSSVQRAPSAQPPPAPARPEAAAPAAPRPSVAGPEPVREQEPPTVELSQLSQPVFDEPTAVPPELTDEGSTVMADDFAVEAGERELSVEPGDQTVLLGGEETEGPAGEDIWSEVQHYSEPSPPSGGEPQDESATVFMSPPPEEVTAEPPVSEPEASPFDLPKESPEPSYESGADAWVLGEEPGAQEAEPELTPLGEFGGFEDFSASEQAAPPEPEVYASEPEIFTPDSSSESFDADRPISKLPLTSHTEAGPPNADELPFVEATPPAAPPEEKPPAVPAAPPAAPRARPVEAGHPPMPPERKPAAEAPPPPAPPRVKPVVEAPARPAPPRPKPVVESVPPPAPPKARPVVESASPPAPPKAKPMVEPEAPPAPPPPKAKPPVEPLGEFTPIAEPSPWSAEHIFEPPAEEPPDEEPLPSFEPGAVMESEEPVQAGPSFDETPTGERSVGRPSLAPQDIDALVDRIAERVIAKLSEQAIKEVAWEVVPDLAQTLIQREIDALKAKIPK